MPGCDSLLNDAWPLKRGTLTCRQSADLFGQIREILNGMGLPQHQYAGHSFRIGAATSAALAGVKDSGPLAQCGLPPVHKDAQGTTGCSCKSDSRISHPKLYHRIMNISFMLPLLPSRLHVAPLESCLYTNQIRSLVYQSHTGPGPTAPPHQNVAVLGTNQLPYRHLLIYLGP